MFCWWLNVVHSGAKVFCCSHFWNYWNSLPILFMFVFFIFVQNKKRQDMTKYIRDKVKVKEKKRIRRKEDRK